MKKIPCRQELTGWKGDNLGSDKVAGTGEGDSFQGVTISQGDMSVGGI